MDDLISRQAAIDALRNRWLKTINFDGIGEDIAEECEICLRTVPSAQPERKKGKWIEFPNHMAYKCSECGRIIQTTDGRRNVSKHYPFCHCGADMRGEDNV